MSFHLFDFPHPDNSSRTGFSGNRLERLSEKRSDTSVADALADPRARLLLAGSGRALLKLSDGGDVDCWYTRAAAAALGADDDGTILLGFDEDGTPRLAAPVTIEKDTAPTGHIFVDFRSIYIQGLLNDGDLGALAQGAALLAWHETHTFCSRCGSRSDMHDGGYKRICPACGAQHFPRTDAVVIMLTVSPDNTRCLLGRSPHFPDKMYSCLAGFVEPGETLENAVRRETLEEAGVRIGRVAYHASQPWPFPYSMMIGMYGEAESEVITLDDELDDARWFSRAEVKQMIKGNHPDGIAMPPKGAIAWRLVEDWVDALE